MFQSSHETVRNRGLFANHFIFDRIGDDEEWKDTDELDAAWKRAREIWARERGNVEGYGEADLEKAFIYKFFEEVPDHHFRVQLSDAGKRPDYGFFTTREEMDKAGSQGESFYEHAFALGDAKRWGMEFSQAAKTQVINYLGIIRAVKWAILTNGRLWRLYTSESSRAELHYEVDLVNILENDDRAQFRYFYFFFRRAAFVAAPGAQCFLARMIAGSARFTEGVEKDLRNRVYEALRILAEGFVQFSRHKNPIPIDEENLEGLKESLLRLLYRLLFLLYAESRGLLNAKEMPYRSQSLQRMRDEIGTGEIDEEKFDKFNTTLWGRLKQLFKHIDGGKKALGIPAYNGGLFDPAKAPFLETHEIDDEHMATALQKLSISESAGGRIDYRDLGVRQLGSIYEGILEYRLAVANEPMVAVREKNREKWIREADYQPKGRRHHEPPRVAEGELYLVTDKGERKATGSYYTPDYIVQYIVENTIGPLVKEKRKAHAKACAAAERGAAQRGGSAAPPPLWRELLELKVLDPAMGSGHFLVAATEYLARAVVRARTDDEARDRAHGDRQSGDDEGYDWTAPPKQTGGEEAIVWARREVARHCIFGVDLNPMAVELAKLSLWLETISRDKPLSFLDHHLKCGNSLIGARLRDLPLFPGIKGKGAEKIHDEHFDWWKSIRPESFVQKLTEALKEIEAESDDRLEGIKEKERLHAELEKSFRYRKLKTFLDVHTAHYFGLGLLKEDSLKEQRAAYKLMRVKAARGDKSEWNKYRGFEKAVCHSSMAKQKPFFHWELEFPEAFFEGTQQRNKSGFDAIIGNPPWGADIQNDDQKYYNIKYPESTKRVLDTFKTFIDFSLGIINKKGNFGMIIPNPILTQIHYIDIRQVMIRYSITSVVDLGDNVFSDVVTPCCIIEITKSIGQKKIVAADVKRYVSSEKASEIEKQSVTLHYNFYNNTPQNSFYTKIGPNDKLYYKLIRNYTPLEKIHGTIFHDVGINYNRKTVSKKVFYEGEKISELDIPRYKGGSFSRYSEINRVGWLRANYLDLLDEHETISFNKRVFQLKEKIVFRQTSSSIIATIDTSQMYLGRSVIAVEIINDISIKYFLSVFNSKIINILYQNIAKEEGRILAQVKVNKVGLLPFPRIAFTTPAGERERLAADGRKLYAAGRGTCNYAPALAFAVAQLSASPPRSDVVHDLLAFLAEEMMEMHREKQARLRRFRDELSGVLDEKRLARLNRLYTPLREPQRKEREERKRFAVRHAAWAAKVADARRALGALAERRLEFADAWRLDERQFKWCVLQKFRLARGMGGVLDAFRDFVADGDAGLAPLMVRIEATDALIDRVVYALYGLTDEEIAVVEGDN